MRRGVVLVASTGLAILACTPVSAIVALDCTGTYICDATCEANNRNYTLTFEPNRDIQVRGTDVSGLLFLQNEDVAITDTNGTIRYAYPTETGPAGMSLRLAQDAVEMILYIGNDGATHYATCIRREAT